MVTTLTVPGQRDVSQHIQPMGQRDFFCACSRSGRADKSLEGSQVKRMCFEVASCQSEKGNSWIAQPGSFRYLGWLPEGSDTKLGRDRMQRLSP